MDNKTDFCNIPPSIESKIGRNLHNTKNHPIEIVKRRVLEYFKKLDGYDFNIFQNLSPFVSVDDNFDKLLINENHPARAKSDTYYVNKTTVLRTHTSAHQNEHLSKGFDNFLVVGDVYRKDEINSSHYPVFHQMEAVCKIHKGVNPKDELLRILNGLVEHLFPGCKYRVNDDFFPFTEPSYEYEVYYNGNWLEILGCGVVHNNIIKNNDRNGDFIALGLGLDRLAMLFFEIPDIRLLWSNHPRFLEQFSSGKIIKFKPYSELPTQFRDISFWISKDKVLDTINELGGPIKWADENDFFEVVREVVGDCVEEVKIMDEFFHPKKLQHSRMYRIIYSPIDPDMKDPSEFTNMCNIVQAKLVKEVDKLDVTIR